MADANRVREPLELAAKSVDPAVRRMALDYREKLAELEPYEMFFAMYSGARAKVPAMPELVVRADPILAISKPGGSLSAVAVCNRVCDALRQGGPQTLDELHRLYVASSADDTGRDKESLRLVIARSKDSRIGRVSDKDRRYALVASGDPRPAAVNGEYIGA